MNRLGGPLDGLLHLMDRQVVDDRGLMVCKVDDLEVTEAADDSLVVTGLLVGAPVWVPRLGHWFGEQWRRLGDAEADRLDPYRIDIDEIERLTQQITLRHHRAGSLRRQGSVPAGSVRHRLQDLLGATVLGPHGNSLGNVLDVRLQPVAAPAGRPDAGGGLVLTALLVGRGRPGSYLGYDRRGAQGPWLVNRAVRWLHRHSGIVPLAAVDDIDWDAGTVRARSGLDPLTPA
jgi:sporulation protein YlmC with PRC-barrel domain